MTTALGGSGSNQIIVNCHFSQAVTKGHAVSIVATAPVALDSLDNDDMLNVELYDSGNTKFLGVAIEGGVAGEAGPVCVFGLVDAVAGSGVAAGEKVQADPTDGSFLDWTSGAEHGVAVETGASPAVTKILINGLAVGGFGGS